MINYETCINWKEAFDNPKDECELKKVYRRLVKRYHSDETTGDDKCFINITKLYNQGKEFFSKKSEPEKLICIKFIDESTGKEVIVPYIFEDQFEDATIYFGYTKMAVVMGAEKGKYYDNFLKQVRDIKYPNEEAKERFVRLIPKILYSSVSKKGNYCIVLEKTSEIIPLHKVVEGGDFKDKYRHYVWIINRLYDLACLFNYNNKVFNAFNMRNVYISPDYHSVVLLSGWQFCTGTGQKMLGTTKDIYDVMSIQCKDSKKSERLTDLESIKMIGRQLFDKDAPEEFRKFFEEASSGDPIVDWDKWSLRIDKVYGAKREFIHWEGPLIEAYKTK